MSIKLKNAFYTTPKKHYPVDSLVCFVNSYPLDSDLTGG